ncbi:hypothetical protein PHYPO_G00157250 [Pangasianodon hypophthalmus]|uniref:Kinesin motor domain-containing protein n=1 Tax=Pangasianodon hypophthalmus TaxID=310915 RepID=A0A5N5JXE3_PANHP|nr:hypothetical protein PHYPO_G00157250 [Pangasianodon hypophthalmus]
MASSVKVAVRVRPFNNRETNRGAKCVIQMQDKSTCIVNPKQPKDHRKSFTFRLLLLVTQRSESLYPRQARRTRAFASQRQVYLDYREEEMLLRAEGYKRLHLCVRPNPSVCILHDDGQAGPSSRASSHR